MDNPNWSLNEFDFEPYRMEHFRAEQLADTAVSSESEASSSEDSTDENFIPLSSASLPRKRSKSKRNKVVKMRKSGTRDDMLNKSDLKRSQTDSDSSKKKKRHCSSVRYFSISREQDDSD